MNQLSKLFSEIKRNANPEKAIILKRFFKTGPGGYGEGDTFLGIIVPVQREISKKYFDLKLTDLQKLIRSKIHEARLIALFILVHQYKKSAPENKKRFVDFYLKNKSYVNNWDLVDSSAHLILGDYLLDKPVKMLFTLAKSESVWDRRIAVLSSLTFIRKGQFGVTLKLAKLLLSDKHDLMHKGTGWMLREIGNRNEKELEKFLDNYAAVMPRTMLRYAIEKISEKKRKYYLNKRY
jgi:3-methyladenine DNA glycosylase AlkD